MYTKHRLLMSSLLLSYGFLFSEIRTITSLRETQAILETLDDTALVVFDVDNTLIMSVDKIHRRYPEAIAAFIKRLDYKPSRVIFFDDLIDHINTMDHEMKLLGISCVAFHYTATELMQEAIDHEVAAYQFDYLIKHQRWVSDMQARELMNAHVS